MKYNDQRNNAFKNWVYIQFSQFMGIIYYEKINDQQYFEDSWW